MRRPVEANDNWSWVEAKLNGRDKRGLDPLGVPTIMLTRQRLCQSRGPQVRQMERKHGTKKRLVKSGIRTHAPEETGALSQRLRPLGHLDSHAFPDALVQIIA